MLIVYTDGGKRRKLGSWAYVFTEYRSRSSIKQDYAGIASGKIIAYGSGVISNLRSSAEAEIIAARKAIDRANEDFPKQPIVIVSDSTYVVHGLRNPFRMSHNENYKKLWMELIPICMFTKIETVHVKGHSKQTYNTFVDYMCGDLLSTGGEKIDSAVHMFNNSDIWRRAIVKARR